MTSGALLIQFLPFLLSLAGKPGTPMVLCLVSSVLALLQSVDPGAAVLPWGLGMMIAVISVREKIRERRPV